MIRRRNKFKIPVFVFHSIKNGSKNDLFSINSKKFEKNIAFLKKNFEIIDFKKIDDFRKNKKSGIVISFDDGYEDNYKNALPILRKYDVKAVFFILPKFIGKNNLWNTRAESILRHMDKKEIVTLIEEGHTIGSHGISHHKMIKLGYSDIKSELSDSKKMIEKMFKIKVNAFAYPYGSYNNQISKIAGEVYDYCFATSEGFAEWSNGNLNKIKREFIWPHENLKTIGYLVEQFGECENNPYVKRI